MQLSLVTYYRRKPEVLKKMIESLQLFLKERLQGAFRPYQPDQVHATLIGMELFREEGAWHSHWYRENIGLGAPVRFAGLLTQLHDHFPDLNIQIGGYGEDQDHGFISRGDHPYLRTFSFQTSTAVVVGWPAVKRGTTFAYEESFFQLRRSFEAHFLCHKWHKDGYRDNDAYLVLGKVDRTVIPDDVLTSISRELRKMLSKEAVLIPFNPEFLSVVAYEHPELPLPSTRVFPLQELGRDPAPLLKLLNNP